MVLAVDPVARTFTRIFVGTTPIAVAVNPLTNRVYVINQSTYDVSVINGATQTVITTIYTGYTPASIAVDAISNTIYVGVQGLADVLVLDGQTNFFTSIVNVGTFSSDTEFGVTFDAGNKKIWTANYSSDTVSRLRF
jgi:YVTN family beta-propeller protein